MDLVRVAWVNTGRGYSEPYAAADTHMGASVILCIRVTGSLLESSLASSVKYLHCTQSHTAGPVGCPRRRSRTRACATCPSPCGTARRRHRAVVACSGPGHFRNIQFSLAVAYCICHLSTVSPLTDQARPHATPTQPGALISRLTFVTSDVAVDIFTLARSAPVSTSSAAPPGWQIPSRRRARTPCQ